MKKIIKILKSKPKVTASIVTLIVTLVGYGAHAGTAGELFNLLVQIAGAFVG